jgi:hypothetical protein
MADTTEPVNNDVAQTSGQVTDTTTAQVSDAPKEDVTPAEAPQTSNGGNGTHPNAFAEEVRAEVGKAQAALAEAVKQFENYVSRVIPK